MQNKNKIVSLQCVFHGIRLLRLRKIGCRETINFFVLYLNNKNSTISILIASPYLNFLYAEAIIQRLLSNKRILYHDIIPELILYKRHSHFENVFFCWDTRTRTKNDRTRICSVTITPYPNNTYSYLKLHCKVTYIF